MPPFLFGGCVLVGQIYFVYVKGFVGLYDCRTGGHIPFNVKSVFLVIEMPYRPPLLDAGEAGEKAHTVRLGGPTCLAGDIIGDYSFDAPLAEGDKLIFGDMAIYTTCKNNTFNGMPLPPIWLLGADGNCRELVHFGYQDFKMRLGAQ